jgi:hypothetical protein
MTESLTEIIVERFYRFSGYLVEKDVPLLEPTGPQHWSDLDIMAVKNEVVLVNCKDYVSDPSQEKKILDNLESAEKYVRREFAAIVGQKTVTKQFVYVGSDTRTIQSLTSKGVQCKTLDEMLAAYALKLEEFMNKLHAESKYRAREGRRWYRTGNLRGYDKLLQYLLNRNFIKVDGGRMMKWV